MFFLKVAQPTSLRKDKNPLGSSLVSTPGVLVVSVVMNSKYSNNAFKKVVH